LPKAEDACEGGLPETLSRAGGPLLTGDRLAAPDCRTASRRFEAGSHFKGCLFARV